jgi:DNA-binding MarR family transcriptional regulator
VIEPTRAARAVRLSAIRERALDARNTSTASLDRRWLLGEVDRLSTERDQAQSQSHADLDAAIKYNADREDAGRVTSKVWDMVTALELEPDELALYVVLLSYLRSPERMTDRECWPSQKELARAYGRSVDTIQRVMKKLIARGLVHETQREGTSNLYRLPAASSTPPPVDAHQGGTAYLRYPPAADPRYRGTAYLRTEVEELEGQEGKEKNYPGSSIASLSPSVTRATEQDEREVIMAKLAKQHSASAEEIEAAWRMASEPDFPGADEYRTHFRDWFKAWIKEPDEVRQDLANYRDKIRYDAGHAEYAVRGDCDFHRQSYPCLGCAADAKAISDET